MVTIKGNSETVEYDGTKHEVNGYTVVSISSELYTEADFDLAEGAAAHAEGTDADTYAMGLTSASFVNKNANFAKVSFIVEDGALVITKRGEGEKKVKVIANDNTVEYDGKAHGENGYETEYLAEGHSVDTVTIDGSRINVGKYADELVPHDAKIVDAAGNDVTKNYVITYEAGDLEITGDKLIPNKTTPEVESNYKLGDKIPFEITVKNVSDAEVKDVVVEDANATIEADTGYTVVNDHKATIASIASGATVTVKAKHTVTSDDILAGTVGNKATVSWEGTTKNVEASTDDIVSPDTKLTVTKKSDKEGQKVALGEKITYTITVKNEGNVPYYNVNVDDDLTGMHANIAELLVGAKQEFTTYYTVTSADILNGSVLNSVTAKGNPIDDPKDPQNPKTPEGEDEIEDETEDVDVTLTVTKESDKAGKNVALNETITYTITVKNDGNVTYYNVKVDDELTGLYEVIAELSVGKETTFTTQYTVTEADILAGSVTNKVTAKGDPINDPKDPKSQKTPEGEAEVTDFTNSQVGYSYTVKYYRQMLEDNELSDKYELVEDETETYEHIGYGWTLIYDKKDFEGFYYEKTMKTLTEGGEEIEFVEGDTMPANNELEIHVYYVRRTDLTYTIEYRLNNAKGRILSETKVVENCVYGKTYLETPVDLLPEYICDEKEFEMLVTDVDTLNYHVFIYAQRRIYTVEYYYEGVLDTTKTEYYWARIGTVITNYTPKSEGGYRLDHVENCPLMVVIDGTLNVIRVYYTKTPEIIIPDVPLGSGPISLNVGDCFE